MKSTKLHVYINGRVFFLIRIFYHKVYNRFLIKFGMEYIDIYMYFSSMLLIIQNNAASNESFRFWSPDSIKELWCPEKCFSVPSKEESDECCACNAFPQWERLDLFPYITYTSLHVENTNVLGSSFLHMIRKNPKNGTIFYRTVHRHGILRRFPENSCDFRLVLVDLSEIFLQISETFHAILTWTLWFWRTTKLNLFQIKHSWTCQNLGFWIFQEILSPRFTTIFLAASMFLPLTWREIK